ncbi:hypothetical protein ACH5RR_040899 [Cinchona calisaya]|uniref:Uncharacterized protein n=1 Tax=Cinchona calisaya TaxID=153742 RepID=A0ABD2XX81_9GENT
MNEHWKGLPLRDMYVETLEEPITVVSPDGKVIFHRVTSMTPLKLTWNSTSGENEASRSGVHFNENTRGSNVDFNGCAYGNEFRGPHNKESTMQEDDMVSTENKKNNETEEEPDWLMEGFETIDDEDIFAPKKKKKTNKAHVETIVNKRDNPHVQTTTSQASGTIEREPKESHQRRRKNVGIRRGKKGKQIPEQQAAT